MIIDSDSLMEYLIKHFWFPQNRTTEDLLSYNSIKIFQDRKFTNKLDNYQETLCVEIVGPQPQMAIEWSFSILAIFTETILYSTYYRNLTQ